MDSVHASVLKRAVELATGDPTAEPRDIQLDLAGQIADAMRNTSHVLSAAPTGSGKSLAYLVPAALAAAQAGERTVISTESLSLQAQIVGKDLPVVAQAVRQITGEQVSFAVLKGWSNFACSLEAVASARTAAGLDPDAPVPTTPAGLRALADAAEKAMDGVPADARVSGRDSMLVNARELSAAAAWAMRATADQRTGDRHSYPGAVSGPVWDAVSVSASDCLKDSCPLREWCLPAKAKRAAAAADIVVTNHTLLGIQAAKNVPAVLSSRSLGQFHHVVVDEAHGLPGVVRNQGATVISGRQIGRMRAGLTRAVEGWAKASSGYLRQLASSGVSALADGAARQVKDLAEEKKGMLDRINVGFHVGDEVDRDLGAWRAKADRGGVAKLGPEDSPLTVSAPIVARWIADMGRLLKDLQPVGNDLTVVRAKTRLAGRLASLADAVKMVSAHEVGTARWVEVSRDDDSLEAKATPVDIAGALAANVWTSDIIPADGDVDGQSLAQLTAEDPDVDGKNADRVALSVTAVSATLPRGFARDVALRSKLRRYPSPLAQAYEGSVLHIPKPSDADITALSNPYEASRKKFDTKSHSGWALPKVVELVEANGGSTLVLSATASAGKDYARALREAAHGRWQVLSQWDGRLAGAVAADWRDDHSAVLVGTRSYMTGLDAPGATCTLVVLDRPPRSAGNPVDDARVEILVASAEITRWDADRRVYVADATVLLEQAIGRLIRATTDRGMVAVLDPRLLKTNPFSYQEPTRLAYMSAVQTFGSKISDPVKALAWLRAERAARTARPASAAS